jgi:hypothetical protein
MAQPLEVGMFLRVRFYCTAEGQVAINVRHALVTAVVGGAYTDAQMADDVSNTAAGLYRDCIGGGARYEGASVQITSPDLYVSQFSNTEAGVGSGAGDLLPTQVCSLISLGSAFAGRKGRGRMYIPFPSEGMNDANGDPSAVHLVSVITLGDLFTVAFTGAEGVNSATMVWVVSGSGIGSSRPIVNNLPRFKWATQRRRGENTGGDEPTFT